MLQRLSYIMKTLKRLSLKLFLNYRYILLTSYLYFTNKVKPTLQHRITSFIKKKNVLDPIIFLHSWNWDMWWTRQVDAAFREPVSKYRWQTLTSKQIETYDQMDGGKTWADGGEGGRYWMVRVRKPSQTGEGSSNIAEEKRKMCGRKIKCRGQMWI